MKKVDIKRKIVCAANRYEEDVIFPSARHYDKTMCNLIEIYAKTFLHLIDASPLKEGFRMEQGFLDNKGNFLSRKEAYKIARDAGQIIKKTGQDNKLYSEDIY